MKRLLFSVVGISLLVALANSTALFGQIADRAVITGLVTDASGAAVPGAKVTITDQDTGVQTVVATNSAGNYSTPPLILGTYTVQVEKPGFKTFVRSGIVLTGGMHYRQDAQLQIGQAVQTVQVTASSQMINTETPTVSHTLGSLYYHDLPAVMGADIRLAESLLQLQPGYVPVAPNGDAIFRGSQFQSRINGGQSMATENWFDGAAFGYAEGHQQTQESSLPYPAVQEMTVVENTFSAQYGHTSGGFIMYTTKSGTNKFHGNLYDFYTNQSLDARNFFLPFRLPLQQNNSGFDIGGPIPKLKKGGKTFWYFNYDRLDYHSTVNIGYVNTLPTLAERTGDFSALLNTNNVVGHDALGRPIYQGEIFNPSTTRLVNGVPVRDPYPNNIIPSNDPLLSQTLMKNYVPLIPPLDRDTQEFNEFGGTSDDNNKINVWTWLLRMDHTFNDKFSMSNTYYENNRPRIAHCGGLGGCSVPNDPVNDSKANNTYIGQGFVQKITNHFDHLQFNWV
ncbi:MAG TPA: carboxypeptidase-like regulatory domain-containing protein, partial [Verrucomicrobiae bacterium]|nr:carboxypeptidase-like regulatory domain-containing protein [Verrucomicrobiae bacterium]